MTIDQVLTDEADREELRFQAFCADRIVSMLALSAGGKKVLDACAGSGILSLAMAQAIGPAGRVIAVDTSELPLARLEAKIGKFGIGNIDVHLVNDGLRSFRRDYFDEVACSLAWRMAGNPLVTAKEWFRVLRPGGNVLWSVLARDAFQPYAGLLRDLLVRLGHQPIDLPWMTLGESDVVADVLQRAGFEGISIKRIAFGYHLRDTDGWWRVAMAGPLCEWLLPLAKPHLEELCARHLNDVERHLTAEGLWLDVPVLVVQGSKPVQ